MVAKRSQDIFVPPHPAVTADSAVFGCDGTELQMLPISRGPRAGRRSIIVLFFLLPWMVYSCVHGPGNLNRFVDQPQDSVRFNLDAYMMPASGLEIGSPVKRGDTLYFLFTEKKKWTHTGFFSRMVIACHPDSHQYERIPTPLCDEIEKIFLRNDSLFLQVYGSSEIKYYSLASDGNTWLPVEFNSGPVDSRYDRLPQEELLVARFSDPFGMAFPAASDTLYVGCFQAKGQFYCMLKTPSSTLLSRLHGSQLIPVHAFPRYDRVETMRCSSGAQDETLLVLAKAGEGVYDLMEIGPKGNTMIRLNGKRGLETQANDGFEPLMTWLMNHWGRFTFSEALALEESLGGKVAALNVERKYNTIPPEERFEPGIRYHLDCIARQTDHLTMTSTYWVSDVDGSIPAVFLEWDESVPSILWEDGPNEKGEELSRMLTRLLGDEGSRSVSATDITFQTWETDGMTVSLHYQNIIDGNCRLVIY